MNVLTASGKAALEKVASRDESRPVLTTVELSLDAEQEEKGYVTGWLAATDSYKLALVPVSFAKAEKPVAGLYPAAAVKAMIGGPCVFTKDGVKVQGKDGEVVEHKRIEGQFPNWRMLMPEEGTLVQVGRRFALNAKLLYELAQGLGTETVILEPTEAADGDANPLRPIRVRGARSGNGNNRTVDEGPLGIIMPIRIAGDA